MLNPMISDGALADWRAFLRPRIRALDWHFAELIEAQNGATCDALWLAAALVSWRLGQGHVCLSLHAFEPQRWFGSAAAEPHWPDLADWAGQLAHQPMVAVAQAAAPLVLDNERLYLERYWQFESSLAGMLLQRAEPLPVAEQALRTALGRLFPEAVPATLDLFAPPPEPDWQQLACALALRQRFSVISGGPGTGKTTTVVKLLALLLELAEEQLPVIKLAAPTGKAAARLSESIAGALGRLELDEAIRAQMPCRATTLHRLLGAQRDSIEFRHNAENPLHLDVLVVDEASMVDLPLMARLVSALPERARLILLGDKDQLASVEAGSVLGDICQGLDAAAYSESMAHYLGGQTGVGARALQADESVPVIADCLALLRRSYRFDRDSGIGELARAVNRGDVRASETLFEQGFTDIARASITPEDYQQLLEQAVEGYSAYLQRLAAGAPASALLQAFGQFQVLCALREGDFGVDGVNRRIEQLLTQRGLIQPRGQEWYPGRPVIICANDKGLGLANGDVGICISDEQGRRRVAFDLGDGEIRYHLPSRLPAHESVYAMTVHRSQGSEFDRVALLLPPRSNPVITRELIYTAITRAKAYFTLYAHWPVVATAITRRTERDSGLAGRLWQHN